MIPGDESGDGMPPRDTRPSLAWMVTFTDLVSLMLTFFVLQFAMSHVKVGEWQSMIDTLSQSLNPSREKAQALPTADYNISTTFRKRAVNLDYLSAVLEQTAKDDPTLQRARINRLDDRMVISLPGELLFAPSRADLSERASQALFSLGGVLRNVDNQIVIQGFSDPVPPDAGYASNWELSLARAVAVANALRRWGYADDILAYGLADSRYRFLPEMPEIERRAVARRVDIVILPTAGGT